MELTQKGKNETQKTWISFRDFNEPEKKPKKKGKKRTTKKMISFIEIWISMKLLIQDCPFFCRLFLSFLGIFQFSMNMEILFLFQFHRLGDGWFLGKNSLHFNWLANVY